MAGTSPAITLILALIGEETGLNAGLAGLYVALRIAHSLVQAIVNVVVLRFAIFIAASVVRWRWRCVPHARCCNRPPVEYKRHAGSDAT
jgi:hypothetical protein